jgi:hypothetical protein
MYTYEPEKPKRRRSPKKKSNVNVSQNFKKNALLLKLLGKGSKATRKDILNMCDSSLTRAICECTKNVISGRVPLSPANITRMRPYAKHLREITKKKVPLSKRQQIIKQHGGFLPFLLGALAPIITGIISGFTK